MIYFNYTSNERPRHLPLQWRACVVVWRAARLPLNWWRWGERMRSITILLWGLAHHVPADSHDAAINPQPATLNTLKCQ